MRRTVRGKGAGVVLEAACPVLEMSRLAAPCPGTVGAVRRQSLLQRLKVSIVLIFVQVPL